MASTKPPPARWPGRVPGGAQHLGGLAIKRVLGLEPSIPALHSVLAGEESSNSGQGQRLQLGRRSVGKNPGNELPARG